MLPNYLSHANHIRCVPVIAVFSSKGEIKPLYVTINGIQLKIESYSVQENTINNPASGNNWMHFLCDVTDQSIHKQIKLTYNISEHAWFVDAKYFHE